MSAQVGVWIDHSKAVVVVHGQGTTVVESDGQSHTRFTGGSGHPGGDSSLGGGSERRHEERHRHALDRYYDDVIAALGHPEALLIFGPGEAKLELQARLGQSKARPQPAVAVETADKLTDAQIVAKVSAHFDAR